MASNWEQAAADKRSRIAHSIPKEWMVDTTTVTKDDFFDFPTKSGILTSQELEITNMGASELVNKLASGQLKSVEVTLAFCKRAAVGQQLVNFFHEFFPDAALAQAQALDDYYEKHKKPVGPLHGLPISLKDQLRIKGFETTMGYVSWIGKYDDEDSVLTHLLRKAGAVFFVKTSVPQTLMVCETVNNIIGRTLNPRNKDWSCGGSSGGEGAIVGSRGAPIGVGTDIGGSIRVPAAFNFLYGIRPSHGRLPYANMANSMVGQETVHSVVGPMAHSAADLRLFVKAVLQEQPWKYDSKVVPISWRDDEHQAAVEKISSSGLTLGYFASDGNVLPHPPILRGIETVLTAVKKAGHSVVSWEPYKHAYAVDLINKIYVSDGCADVYRDINASGEPAIPNIKDLLNPNLDAVNMNQLWDAQIEKWNYQMEYLAAIRALEAKLGKEIDAIIAPITPTAAIRHNQFKYYGYASAINLLDFTSVVVPVTFADKAIDKADTGYKAINDMDRAVQNEYDAEAYHGAPVAVQIIGKRLTEEKTLAIAEEIGRLLGN